MSAKRRKKGDSAKRLSKGRANSPEKLTPNPTTVQFPLWLRIFRRTQSILTIATTVGVFYYRNTHSLYFVANILTTSFIAKGLKLVIRQPRPDGSAVTKTHGMPSTHSSTTMFMGAYLSLALYCYPSYLSANHRMLLMPALLALPPAIMYSRVRLGVHTTAQCIVGGLLGLTNAFVCTALWQGWFRGGVGLAKSNWVTDADEYFGLAQELAGEWFNS